MLLIHQLPPVPTNLRVRTWRKLQKLGALSIKNSVYVLPFNEKTQEDFQWLKQEIEASGGEATVFHAGSVEGATDEEIINAFRKVSDEEYARLASELDGLTGKIREQKRGGHLSTKRLGDYEVEFDKLHTELEFIASTDFFEARGRAAATTAYKRCQKALRDSHNKERASARVRATRSDTLDIAQYQGQRWVTRSSLHIDRLACAWLIKQFIDKRPRFYFVAEGEGIEGAIPFDMFGAEFTHQGEDCTFETMLKRFGLADDKALCEIGEIVHDVDLKDNKFNRLETAGINAAVLGLSKLLKDDRKLLQQSGLFFDSLYMLFSAEVGKGEEKGDGAKKRSRSHASGKRKK